MESTRHSNCNLVHGLELNKCELALEPNTSAKTGLSSASDSWQEQSDSVSSGSYQRKQIWGLPLWISIWGNQGWKRGLSEGCCFSLMFFFFLFFSYHDSFYLFIF